MIEEYLKINPEVELAIQKNQPVVALESTIISHGMPYPQNVETALKCEQIIRENGALPATIGIIDGKMIVGLTKEEINLLGKLGPKVIKTSRRDLPVVLSNRQTGATTVASTMYIASLAQIKVFATGGIGGVHRGVEATMDISADLEELANTNVCVVCAGAKAILDLPRTLEYLETKGVPVIGYQTSYLPAFYTKSSPYKLNIKMDTPSQIGNMLKIKWDVGLNGGVLVCNPIPDEASLPEADMNEYINQALMLMKKENIKGKETTPFLLKTIVELSKGRSLKANIALVFNNCKLAAEIANSYNK